MNLFLNGEVDAAAAMTYNELAQVLETENPDTGELYTLDDLNVMKMSDVGTGALEDGIFVRGDWIEDDGQPGDRQELPEGDASKGWIVLPRQPGGLRRRWCSTNGPTLGEGHQRWQMNEINKLIWPNAPNGIGDHGPAEFDITERDRARWQA